MTFPCFTAIDLQECGLTDTGAQALLEALKLNSTVLILDIRGNHLVNRSLVEQVIQQVLINADGKTSQVFVPSDFCSCALLADSATPCCLIYSTPGCLWTLTRGGQRACVTLAYTTQGLVRIR